MPGALDERRIAFLVANEGVEQVELTEPWDAVKDAGATPVLLAPEPGHVQAFDHHDRADRFTVDEPVEASDPSTFTGLVLPGGVINADALRTYPHAVRFVREFIEEHKPIAVIGHGPWILIETGALHGRTLASWPSLRTDITYAGAEWVDEEVVVDRHDGTTIVSSRKPADLPAFCLQMIRVFGETPASAARFAS